LTGVVCGAISLADRSHPTPGAWVFAALGVISGLSLLIGFLTPVTAASVGLWGVGSKLWWAPVGAPSVFDAKPCVLFLVVMALVAVLVGPGAYSLDARVFGRREIIIPDAPRPDDSGS
jgi:uncharacterized membrane protein YphA (DoxX/SURF4 family)